MPIDPIETPYVFNGQPKPGIWRYLLPTELHTYRLPEERKATCGDCPEAKFDGYDATYRCCSYHPLVPNFLLGLALRQPVSARAVRNLVQKGWVLPEGMQRTPHQWADYLVDLGEDKFGEAKRTRCPNLNPENGFCTIHAFRNGVCSTFFCLHDHGTKGEKFWTALEDLVTQMESALSQWALAESGFDVRAYFRRLDKLAPIIETVADPHTRCWNKKTLKYLWGRFYGSEIELLKKCGELIAARRSELWSLADSTAVLEAKRFDRAMDRLVPKKHRDQIDPEDLEETEDISLSELLADVRKRYRELRKIPTSLKLSPRIVIEKNPCNDAESRAHADKAYRMDLYSRKGGHTVEWSEFLTEQQARRFEFFKKSRRISEALLREPLFQGLFQPLEFLAENVGKRAFMDAHLFVRRGLGDVAKGLRNSSRHFR